MPFVVGSHAPAIAISLEDNSIQLAGVSQTPPRWELFQVGIRARESVYTAEPKKRNSALTARESHHVAAAGVGSNKA